MLDELRPFGLAFAVVFVAELGDKTQLALLALSSRHRARPVILAALAAFALLTVVAVLAGAALAGRVSRGWVDAVAGFAFLAFGAWTLLDREEGNEDRKENKDRKEDGVEEDGSANVRRKDVQGRLPARPFVGTFLLVLGAEFLDKTQLATAALASGGFPLATGLGSFLALACSAILAVLAGAWLSKHVAPRAIRIGAACMFLLVGLFLVLRAWSG